LDVAVAAEVEAEEVVAAVEACRAAAAVVVGFRVAAAGE
jgi:hypothetical protein